jgi:protein phosphatase
MAAKVSFFYGVCSDVGAVRESNQDSAVAAKNLLLVADGMGGHAGGDVASTITTTMLASLDNAAVPRGLRKERLQLKEATDLVERSIVQVYLAILEAVKRNPELTGMGTTLTGILRTDSTYLLFHLGDSRAYRIHGGELHQLTKDHTFVQHLVDTGKITMKEAANHPQKNVVMRVLGDFEVDLNPDYDYFPLTIGDRYFLCSDGICGTLEDEDIQKVLVEIEDPQAAADELVRLSIERGSTDNCTAVVADVKYDNAQNRSYTPVYAGAAQEALQDHLNELISTSKEAALKQHPIEEQKKPKSKSWNPFKRNSKTGSDDTN